MDNFEDELSTKFGDLASKLEKLKAKSALVFSANTIAEFCRGFDSPIIGSLAYLKQQTSTHLSIQCITSCLQLNVHTITDFESYDDFASDLLTITPPIVVDFTFRLTNSIYPIGDISETFSVYFSNGEYQIVYPNEGGNEFRLVKQYMSHIEPDEIRQLRDMICSSIINEATRKIDALL